VRIEFAKVDNRFIIVYKVLQRGRKSIKVYKRLIEGKGY
jgi:hypothetical protein